MPNNHSLTQSHTREFLVGLQKKYQRKEIKYEAPPAPEHPDQNQKKVLFPIGLTGIEPETYCSVLATKFVKE